MLVGVTSLLFPGELSVCVPCWCHRGILLLLAQLQRRLTGGKMSAGRSTDQTVKSSNPGTSKLPLLDP